MAAIPLPNGKAIGDDRIFLIAEIGKNFIDEETELPWQVGLEKAKKLVDAAAESGADAVKFQTHVVDDEQYPIDISSPHAPEFDRFTWVSRNTRATPPEFWKELKTYCDARNIIMFSTPMSRAAAILLEDLGMPLWKVGSGDVRDALMLKTLVATRKPILLSTGMVSFAELNEALRPLQEAKIPYGLFYCVSHYPAPPESFNLASLRKLERDYPDAVIGFSDHSLGHDAALAAAKLGARMIEKHFSFSRDLWGPDHKVSMTPNEFSAMAEAMRSGAYKTVDETPFQGHEEAELEGATNKHRPYFQKALVAARDIEEGTVLTENDLCAMRPLLRVPGIPAWELSSSLGRKTNRMLKRYTPIDSSCFA